MKAIILALALMVLFAGCTQAIQDNQQGLDEEISSGDLTNDSLVQDLDSMIIEESDTVDLGSII